jgi:hypothetical protein
VQFDKKPKQILDSSEIMTTSVADSGVPHPASLPAAELRAQCELRFQRRSGPGGQHRNKVETSVHLLHQPTGVRAAASERRAQGENLKVAWHRLRTRLALEVRQAWCQPSDRWQQRCRGGKLAVSGRHQDYPALLAEALDALARFGWQHRLAAEQLGCSPTQLIRLLRLEAESLIQLNQHRSQQGLGPLR